MKRAWFKGGDEIPSGWPITVQGWIVVGLTFTALAALVARFGEASSRGEPLWITAAGALAVLGLFCTIVIMKQRR